MGALGMETPAGDLEIIDYCFAGMAPQAPLHAIDKENAMDVDSKTTDSKPCSVILSSCILTSLSAEKNLVGGGSTSGGEWIGFVSGLDMGMSGASAAENNPAEMSRQLLVEYLAAEAGGMEASHLKQPSLPGYKHQAYLGPSLECSNIPPDHRWKFHVSRPS